MELLSIFYYNSYHANFIICLSQQFVSSFQNLCLFFLIQNNLNLKGGFYISNFEMTSNAAQPYIESDNVLQRPGQLSQEDTDTLGKGMGSYFCVLAAIIGCFNLAFIVPNLVYAYEGTQCVLSPVQGFSFNLSTWLQVDAYLRIAIVVLLMIMAIATCISFQNGLKCAMCVICIMLVYSFFSLIWTIVGSVLFWGRLNPTGICTGPVRDYMYALLIITYIAGCCNCLFSLNSGKKQRDGEAL